MSSYNKNPQEITHKYNYPPLHLCKIHVDFCLSQDIRVIRAIRVLHLRYSPILPLTGGVRGGLGEPEGIFYPLNPWSFTYSVRFW